MDETTDRLMRLERGSMFAGYRVEGLLDRGGMGVVYKATDVDLQRIVALKIIAPEHTQNPDAVARFKSEARLAASLEHPNIVPIHRGGEFDGILYLAMRFVPGTNLRQIIDQGPLPPSRVQRVINQVASALDAAHARGLVHRDVKPANILISGEGEHEHVYLTDFGLTKELGTAGSLTRTGMWVGTPDYVAPEQIQGQKIDGRTDVYSLGCVLYEMLTGSVAFPRDNDAAKLWAHMTERPPPPTSKHPELAPAFDEVVARATAKNPEERYSKASELAAALGRAIAGQETKAQADLGGAPRPPDATVQSPPVRGDVFAAEATQPAPAVPHEAPAPEQETAPPAPPPGHGEPTVRRDDGGPDRAGWPRRLVWPFAAGLALIVGVVAVVVLASGSSEDDSSNKKAAGTLVSGPLAAVPTNHVEGAGTASLRVKGNVATVTVHADGLLNNAPHAMHIHAGAQGKCPPASAAKLHDGHRAISTSNGAPFYGKPRTALTTTGATGPASILAFQRYPATGKITYRRAIKLIPSAERFVRKNNAVIVVHGIDYNDNGIYDGVIDRSELDAAVQGETTAPALCGRIVAAGSSSSASAVPRRPGGARVYTASLTLQAPAPSPPSWLCALPRATS